MEHTRWLRAASEILNAPTPELARELFVGELMRETHADTVTRVGLTPQDPDAIEISVEARERMPPREHWPRAAQARAHPLGQYYATTCDHAPVRLTDLLAAGWTLDDAAHDAMAALGITEHQMTVPCDTPLFPQDLVARLAKAAQEGDAEIAMAAARESDGQLHAQPVFCLMRVELLESLVRFTHGGGRKTDAWTGQHKTVMVPFDTPQDDPRAFFNANTLAELHQLEHS